ncbi:MAG: hypothetical protein ACO1RA_16585 [Planctomycetaceae bacterium]
MTSVLEPASDNQQPAVSRLRATMAAVRVTFTWLGTRKALTPDQRSQAAETFGAEHDFLSAGKKLLDVAHPSFRAVTGARSRIVAFWRSISLPYPEPAVRLIRQDDIQTFIVQMTTMKADLMEAVGELESHYLELKRSAQDRLGQLYSDADYPPSLSGLFDVAWDFPSVEPPNYLRQLSPKLYEQEAARVAARFDEALEMAETAFTEELTKLISHLVDRLGGDSDGQPKVFRNSAIENLQDFFLRFRHLNIRSSEELESLVGQAQRIVRGVEPQQLRDNSSLREHIGTELSRVQATLDDLLVDRPRRNLLRRAK